jgi:hypothetical protein
MHTFTDRMIKTILFFLNKNTEAKQLVKDIEEILNGAVSDNIILEDK